MDTDVDIDSYNDDDNDSNGGCFFFCINHPMTQQRIWNSTGTEERDEKSNEIEPKENQEQTIGFSVENAVLFPAEVEKGRWPEDYSLSDHARLTVVFAPIRMPCSQLIS